MCHTGMRFVIDFQFYRKKSRFTIQIKGRLCTRLPTEHWNARSCCLSIDNMWYDTFNTVIDDQGINLHEY